QSVGMRTVRDLAENQILTWKIGNYQSRPPLSAIGARKRNDNDFAGYRFYHSASSSGEFQSRASTDSLSSAPLKATFSSDSFEACSFSPNSDVFMKQLSHLPRRTRSTQRNFSVQRSDLTQFRRERS